MSPALEYVARSVLLGGCCFVVGFLLGRMTRDTQRIADVITEGEPVQSKEPRRRPSYQAVMGVVVVVLGLGTAAQGIYQDSATRRIADCTRAYSNGFADAIDARSAASAASQNALDDLMTNVGKLASTEASPEAREQFRKSLSEYLAKRAEAKKQQQENPYPPAPRDVCSE